MQDDPDADEYEKNIQQCKELHAQIKSAINDLDAATKKELQSKLKSANLPTAFHKVTDVNILKQILDIVSA